MKVASGNQVSLEYTLKLDDQTVVDTNVGGDPLVYEHGAGQMIPGLERALEGMGAGEDKQVMITPDDAYGPVVDDAIQQVPIERLPDGAREVGAQVQAQTGEGQTLQGRVIKVEDGTAILDFNHPLAGHTLHFTVKVLDITAA